jgi:hypothetical protein
MDLLSHLLNAFCSTILVAATAYWVIRWLAPLAPARFGAFTLAIGYALARYSGSTPPWVAMPLLVLAMGTLSALTLLWVWWFRNTRVGEGANS